MKLRTLLILCASLILSFQGCVKRQLTTPGHEGDRPFYHVVRYEGETVGIVAKWYTGDAKNWTKIVEANKGMEPTKITAGDSILIPAELLTTRERLPQDFVNEQNRLLSKKNPAEVPAKLEPTPTPTPAPEELSPTTEELIKTRDDLWRELMGE